MKNIIITLSLLVSFNIGISQTEKTKSYHGETSIEEVLDYLAEEEKKSFYTCLRTAGIDPGNVIWCQKNLTDSISKNNEYCNVLNVTISTDEEFAKTKIRKGVNTLLQPQCIIFIIRETKNTQFLFQVYH